MALQCVQPESSRATLFPTPAHSNRILFFHDSQITIWGVSALFAQEGCEDGEEEEFGDVFFAGVGEET
jgi:hypothetical protein